MSLDKVKILADELYNQKILDGWKNVSMEDCLKRATDYYIIDEIVKNKTKMSKEEFYNRQSSIGYLYWLDSNNTIKQGPSLWGIGRYRSWLLLDKIQNSNEFIKWLN